MQNRGSEVRLVQLDIQGVLADGVIDTGSDVLIMSQKLFARVASVAKLHKKNFRMPDKVTCTYNRKTFHLDRCMDHPAHDCLHRDGCP